MSDDYEEKCLKQVKLLIDAITVYDATSDSKESTKQFIINAILESKLPFYYAPKVQIGLRKTLALEFENAIKEGGAYGLSKRSKNIWFIVLILVAGILMVRNYL